MMNFSSNKKNWTLFLLFALSLSSLAGCNAFSIIDKPSGDEQQLSAARACFDEGDFECARKHYASLSNDYSEIRASEEAFLILAENGLNMAAFMETFGNGGGANALTSLAERLAQGTPSKRLKIQEAYIKHTLITSNLALRGLVRFIGSIALAAEFLAEEIPTQGGRLNKINLVLSTSCSSNTACTLAGNVNCTKPVGAVIQDAPNNLNVDLTQPAALSGTLDLRHLKQAMSDAAQALSSLNSSGDFSSGSGAMANTISGQNLDNTPLVNQCFRSKLLEIGIGR